MPTNNKSRRLALPQKMIETRQIDLTPEEYHVPEARRRALMRELGLGEAEAGKARVVRRTGRFGGNV